MVRKTATGDDGVISNDMIHLLAKLGMEIHLSEYDTDVTRQE
jgi:hypothetical protein